MEQEHETPGTDSSKFSQPVKLPEKLNTTGLYIGRTLNEKQTALGLHKKILARLCGNLVSIQPKMEGLLMLQCLQ